MATAVESRECPKCHTKYRTKLKKGKDARSCPTCSPKTEQPSMSQ